MALHPRESKITGFWFLLFAMVSVTPAGCGGDARRISREADQHLQPVSVHIIESAATVEVTTTLQFHFDVSNATYPTCTWAVNDVAGGNATVGTITREGLYTAPAAVPTLNTVTVRATATADTTKSDTATITIRPTLAISPATPTVNSGATQQFTGNLTHTKPDSTDPQKPRK